MARKPLDQLSPTYRRRIERAEAAGKTRQQARGHKAKEHVERKRRERQAEGGLTKSELRTVFTWGERRSYEIVDSTLDGMDYVYWAQSVGYDKFKIYRKTWEAARRKYKREAKNGAYASQGMVYLEVLTAQAGAPDVSWLYYH